MERTLLLGKNKQGGKVEARVSIEDGRLSISASSWNRSHSDIFCGGQLRERVLEEIRTFLIPRSFIEETFLPIWERWHLNDLRPGCEHQRTEEWRTCDQYRHARGECFNKEIKTRAEAEMLGRDRYAYCEADMLGAPCPVCGYAYGSAWIREALPTDLETQILGWPSGEGV
jgi:hypothetical protein